MLPPTANEGALTQIIAEKKGKHRVETKESSTFELLILL